MGIKMVEPRQILSGQTPVLVQSPWSQHSRLSSSSRARSSTWETNSWRVRLRATLTRAIHQPLPTAVGRSIMCFSNMLSQCVRVRHVNSSSSAVWAEQGTGSGAARNQPRCVAPIDQLIPPSSASSAPVPWSFLGSRNQWRSQSRFAQQQQQQNVVEAAPQDVSSTPSTHGSMAVRSGCAPCCMRVTHAIGLRSLASCMAAAYARCGAGLLILWSRYRKVRIILDNIDILTKRHVAPS